VTPGGAVALGLWLAMSLALRVWVANFANYSATYGSIGGVILLMLWLYLTSYVLLVGAEVDAEIEARRRGPSGRGKPRAPPHSAWPSRKSAVVAAFVGNAALALS